MHKGYRWKKGVTVLLVAIAAAMMLLAAGCGNREKKAQSVYDQAQASLAEGHLDLAEQGFRRLQQEFPKAKVTQKATEGLAHVEKLRQEAAYREAIDLLKRLADVVEGYRAFAGVRPSSLDDFDSGGYFFDSAYLADIVLEGYRARILFAAGETPLKIWLQKEGAEYGYLKEEGGRIIRRLPAAQMGSEMDSSYRLQQSLKNLQSFTMIEGGQRG